MQTALDAYEQAGVSGLCGEGRWELAVQAIRNLDLIHLLAMYPELKNAPSSSPS